VDSFSTRVEAALAVCPPGTALGGATALRLHGVALPSRLQTPDCPIHVLLPPDSAYPAQRPQLLAIHRHMGGRVLATQIQGLRVAAPADAWIQACPDLHPGERVAVGDRLLDYSKPPSTWAEIDAALERFAGWRGIRGARAARSLMRAGTESFQESVLRLTIVNNGLPEPAVNVTILDQDGKFVSRSDLVYEVLLIVLEYDGAGHRSPEQVHKDDFQRRALRALGYVVIVVTAQDLRAPSHVIDILREAIAFQRATLAA
jgi:very-short-patch-repair endonuclease